MWSAVTSRIRSRRPRWHTATASHRRPSRRSCSRATAPTPATSGTSPWSRRTSIGSSEARHHRLGFASVSWQRPAKRRGWVRGPPLCSSKPSETSTRRCATGGVGSHRRPTWRKAGLNEGVCVRDVSVQKLNRKWAQVHVPKLGSVRFRLSRPMPAEHGMGRITLDRSGRWHVSFNAPQPTFERVSTGRKVGIDLGIARSITTSAPHHRVPAGATNAERRSRRRTLDGTPLDMPLLLTPGEAQRKRRLQRQMARQQKGSHRRARTKHAIAALSAREADRRRDWTEKVTTGLVRDYDFIAHEDLRPKNMSRSAKGTIESPGTNVAAKRSLNRSILSQNWGTTITRLGDKAAASPPPCEVVAVDPRGSSQECSECHHRARENRKSQAVFHCVSCGHAEHADDNASKNILAAGLAVAGRGGTSHAPSKSVEYAQRPDEASTSRVLVSV